MSFVVKYISFIVKTKVKRDFTANENYYTTNDSPPDQNHLWKDSISSIPS